MNFIPSNPKKIIPLILFASFMSRPVFAINEGGSLEDSIAEVVSWVAIIVVPIVGIAVFLFVHVLPERIAEKRNHPQAEAIKVLCLLSLLFGGLLWPLAWLWAYSKPVFYKMAYGTDKGDYHEKTMKDIENEKKTDENSIDIQE